jgi:hypothetical protein
VLLDRGLLADGCWYGHPRLQLSMFGRYLHGAGVMSASGSMDFWSYK